MIETKLHILCVLQQRMSNKNITYVHEHHRNIDTHLLLCLQSRIAIGRHFVHTLVPPNKKA